MGSQIQGIAALPAPQGVALPEVPLRIFDTIPIRHGVVPIDVDGVLLRAGDVAVYDELALSLTEGLIDGGLYAIEYQSPRSGMTWEMFRRQECTRVQTSRNVIIAARSKNPKYPDHWYAHPVCGAGVTRGRRIYCSDGPYSGQWHLADKIVGEVVGVYRGRQFDVEVH